MLPGGFPNLLANGAAGIAVGMACSIPPHNAGELCDALLHLIKTPNARIDTLVDLVKGPDFPTGGILVEPREAIVEAYKTGRGAFRLRAKWEKEELPRGQYRIIVTEIPYQVQKGKLIERIAEIINAKKLPILEDVHDELADDVRIVLEPRTGQVPAELLMEQLFRQTDLEIRFPLNLNVLDKDNTPRVMDLREALQAFLDHRREVLVRRSTFRLAEIERRLEILDGYLIAYLNLDKLIKIIREEDEPKPKMIKAFKLTDLQAEAILNMRLRALRRLEEFEIKGEHKKLTAERKDLKALLKDEKLQWGKIADEVQETKRKFGGKTPLGRRRTELADAPAEVEHAVEDFVEREPVTIVCSDKGWIRAAKGHLDDKAAGELKYKEGDGPRFAVHAQSTDKILVFGTNGRFYTLGCDKLPSARGHGEPIRLMIELGNEQDIVDARRAEGRAQVPGRLGCRPRLHRAGRRGRGADQERQAGAEPRRQGEGAGLRHRAGGCRFDRCAERRPQAPDLPDGAGAGDGPRPRRDRCRSPRPIGCRTRRPSGSRTACRGPTASSRRAS